MGTEADWGNNGVRAHFPTASTQVHNSAFTWSPWAAGIGYFIGNACSAKAVMGHSTKIYSLPHTGNRTDSMYLVYFWLLLVRKYRMNIDIFLFRQFSGVCSCFARVWYKMARNYMNVYTICTPIRATFQVTRKDRLQNVNYELNWMDVDV